jgi:hypothetical protein
MSPAPSRKDERTSLTPNTPGVNVGRETARTPGRRTADRKKGTEWEPFSTYLPADVRHDLRVVCATREIEIRDAVTAAVRAWIAKNQD